MLSTLEAQLKQSLLPEFWLEMGKNGKLWCLQGKFKKEIPEKAPSSEVSSEDH